MVEKDVKKNAALFLSVLLSFWWNDTSVGVFIGNIAKGRPTLQSSTLNGGISSRAVDGNSNAKWNGGSCTRTRRLAKPWWRVDLGVVHKVNSVKITNREDCCWTRLSNVEIRVGMTDKKPASNKLCKYQARALARAETKQLNCTYPRIGRYVFVALRKNQYLTLCEVQVFAASPGCYDDKKRKWYSFNQTFSPKPCLRCKCNMNSSIICNQRIPAIQKETRFCIDCSMRSKLFRYACNTCFDALTSKTYSYLQKWKPNNCTKCYCYGSGTYCRNYVASQQYLPKFFKVCRRCNVHLFVKKYPCTTCYNAVTRKTYKHGQHWRIGDTCVMCQCVAGKTNCARPGLLIESSGSRKALKKAPLCVRCFTGKLKRYLRRFSCKKCHDDALSVAKKHGTRFIANQLSCFCYDGTLNCRMVIPADIILGTPSRSLYCGNCSVSESLEKFTKKGCDFQGKWIENGKIFFVGFGDMPYCMRCQCYNGNVTCLYATRLKNAIKIVLHRCSSNATCTAAAKTASRSCQNDVSLNCNTGPPSDSWQANGCRYLCDASKLNSTFIEKPWCQSISKSKYCAICPDKKKFFQQYGHVYGMCELEGSLISREKFCDGVANCYNGTDERNCTIYYCKTFTEIVKKKEFVWKRAPLHVTKRLECRHVMSNWEGVLTRTCLLDYQVGAHWTALNICQCYDSRPDPFKMEFSNVTAESLKAKALKIENYTKEAVTLERSLELATILAEQALKLDFTANVNGTKTAKDFSRSLRDTHMTDGKIICRKAQQKAKSKQLDLKIKEFNNKYNFSNRYIGKPKSSIIKVLSVDHNAFLQDVLFPETGIASGTDTDSLEASTPGESIEYGKTGMTLNILHHNSSNITNTTYTDNKFYKATGSKQKIKTISIHIRIQLILDITFAMISLIALSVAVFLMFAFDVPGTTKLFIHKNLFVALLILNLLYVTGSWTEKALSKERVMCTTFVILQYYFSLAQFSWMSVEGVNLFTVIVLVFQSKTKKHNLYAAAGWGIPLIAFVIAIAARPDAFLKSAGCISLGKDVWFFKGPMSILLGVNLILFVLILWMVLKNISSTQRLKTSPQRLRSTLRAFITLVPVLGISHILGLVIETHPVIFGYLYVIINGLMGWLFSFLHCFLDPQVQEAVQKFRKRRHKSMQIYSSQTAPRSPATSFSCSQPKQDDDDHLAFDTKL